MKIIFWEENENGLKNKIYSKILYTAKKWYNVNVNHVLFLSALSVKYINCMYSVTNYI